MYYGYEDFVEDVKTLKTYCVKDINLLYALSQDNLLEYLVGVTFDKNNPNKRVWIFQLNSYVQDVINSYYSGLYKYKHNNKKVR